MNRLPFALAALALAVTAVACGGGAGASGPKVGGRARTRSLGDGRPQLAVVTRTGDAEGGLAVAVTTEGIAPERGAVVGVALAALVEGRLAARSDGPGGGEGTPVVAAGGWSGYRLRTMAAGSSDVAPLIEAIRRAMLTPVAAEEPALGVVRRKVEALARRPLPDRAMVDVVRCTGEAFGLGADTPPSVAELEAWRAAAHGSARVAFAVAGDEAFASAVADGLASGSAWPTAAPRVFAPWPTADAPAITYDASSEITQGAARVVVLARTAVPGTAVEPAAALGDPRGPLASRLSALEAPARIRSVIATAHGDGGCIAVTLDVAARDLERDAPARIATAAALARQEITVELAEASGDPDTGGELAQRAADPRDAAERAAWWSLAGHAAGGEALRVSMVVGLAASRDAGTSPAMPSAELRSELDRATIAWHAPVVEGRTRVEPGQGETWILLASPCGTLGEAADAGSGAAVATAAALAASRAGSQDVQVEPFVAADGVGVLAHGPSRPGESPQAHGRRLADLAARAFAADALDRDRMAQARTNLLARTSETETRVLGAAAGALAPGHASWVAPVGTTLGLASISDDDLEQRAAALRAGPLRVAVLASSDQAQADAAVRAVDRWVARRPGEVRSCPAPASARPRPGTYGVPLPSGARSEALLAAPFAPQDEAARTSATWVSAALDGPDGLLARALGSPPGEGARTLATAWSVSVIGAPQSPAVAVRLLSDDASLDAAVAQTRVLLDRVRQGALRDEDRARAGRTVARDRLAASLEPRVRTVALWRGESAKAAPTTDALRAFASATLRDEALVIVAARPPRPATSHDGKPRAH